MRLVTVSCDHNFMSLPRFLSELQSNLVSLLGSYIFSRREGLRLLIKECTVCFMVSIFCYHEFFVGVLAVTIYSADQSSA